MKGIRWVIAGIVLVALIVAGLMVGSVGLTFDEVLAVLTGKGSPLHELIVLHTRLPRTLTAVSAGGILALCGLLMQTYFHNPLAGPSVLGITSGASLGVAMAILAGIGVAAVPAAIVGSMMVLVLVLMVASRLKGPVSLLIFGLMLGYLTSSVVTVLQQTASKEALKAFIFWGMGSFSGTDLRTSSALCIALALFGILVFSRRKQLDIWLLGSETARTMGVSASRFTLFILLITGFGAGVVTAFAGPIAFLGLAVPHVARGVWQEGSHKALIPAVISIGMIIGLGCDLITRAPWLEAELPLNAVTSLVGAPVVIYIILKGRRVFG
ncbi:MAG: hypothetical protein RL226_2299 [Bacteroidota bacterium]